jgi:hypothetical protein
VKRESAAQIGERKRGLAIASVCGADQIEKRLVFGNGKKLSLAKHPTRRRKISGKHTYLADIRLSHNDLPPNSGKTLELYLFIPYKIHHSINLVQGLGKDFALIHDFTENTFRPHLMDSFQVRANETVTLNLRLVEVQGQKAGATAPRKDPFAILFSGPKTPILPQKIYRMSHAAIGDFELFIVPVGPNKDGLMQYEAIFN